MGPADVDNSGSSSLHRIEKLAGHSNWMSWKTNIKMVLIDKGQWSVVNPLETLDYPVASSVTKTKLDKALATIYLSMEASQQMLILTCKDGREAYKKLSETYDTQDPASQLARKTAFHQLRQDAAEGVVSWTSRVMAEAAECVLIGCSISDDDQVAVILNGLTSSYHHIKSNLYAASTLTGSKLTLTAVTKTLVSSEIADNVSSGLTPSAFLSSSRSSKPSRSHNGRGAGDANGGGKRKGKCNWCKIEGHWERECRKKEAGVPRQSDSGVRSVVAPGNDEEFGGLERRVDLGMGGISCRPLGYLSGRHSIRLWR